MYRLILPAIAVLFFAFSAAAQLPTTNVFMLDMEQRDSLIYFSNPQFLTGFNKSGYNNQPSFISNTELLLTVAEDKDAQTDIYLLDLERKTKLRMTKTPESEYSPRVMPGELYFTVVRVETDADRSQRLWQYPLDRADKGKPVLRYLRGVGYYHWLDHFRVALFNVSQTNYLSLADIRDGSARHLAPNVGRSFDESPNGRLVFVHKLTENNWMIKAMNKETLDIQEIIKTLPGSEDFVILKDGSILMGKGSRLYKFHPIQDKDWMEIADLNNLGIFNITRMATNNNGQLVIVNGGG